MLCYGGEILDNSLFTEFNINYIHGFIIDSFIYSFIHLFVPSCYLHVLLPSLFIQSWKSRSCESPLQDSLQQYEKQEHPNLYQYTI